MAKPFEENSLKRLFLGATFGAFLDSGGDIFSEICKSNIVNELGNPGLVEGTIAVQAWRRSNHMIHCTIIPPQNTALNLQNALIWYCRACTLPNHMIGCTRPELGGTQNMAARE